MTAKNDLAQAVVIVRTYNAPVGKVWKALTDVDQMRQWYFDLREFKPEVGFEFSFVVEHNGNTYEPVAKSPKSFRERKSPTLGDMRTRKAIHWLRLNCSLTATRHG